MKRFVSILTGFFIASALMTVPVLADSKTMTGSWNANKGSGKLTVTVTGSGGKMQLKGSCSGNSWLKMNPANAVVYKGGEVVINSATFKVPIKSPCGTATVKATKTKNGVRFTFRNKYNFRGGVK